MILKRAGSLPPNFLHNPARRLLAAVVLLALDTQRDFITYMLGLLSNGPVRMTPELEQMFRDVAQVGSVEG